MTILVTGGAGFIGSNFVLDWFERNDEAVINLDVLSYAGNLSNLESIMDNDRHLFVRGDIGNSELTSELLSRHTPRAIINFAADTHVDRSIHEPGSFVQTNIVGTFNLLEAARRYWRKLDNSNQAEFRFLHVSTDEVYGSLAADAPAFSETSPYRPNSPYSASKASSDHLVRAFFQTYGLPTLTTNCSNNYGPYQFPEKLVALMVLNANHGKSLPIYGDGQQRRDWLYVGDHCAAVRRILDACRIGEVYNIGGGQEMSNLEMVTTICKILDELLPNSEHRPHTDLVEFVPDRPGHDRRYAIDCSKLEKELGWTAAENLESGIRKTIEWYLENETWTENVVSGSYMNWIEQNYGERR